MLRYMLRSVGDLLLRPIKNGYPVQIYPGTSCPQPGHGTATKSRDVSFRGLLNRNEKRCAQALTSLSFILTPIWSVTIAREW